MGKVGVKLVRSPVVPVLRLSIDQSKSGGVLGRDAIKVEFIPAAQLEAEGVT